MIGSLTTVCDLVTRIRGWFRDAASGRLIREDDRFEATRIESALGICVYDDDQFCRYVENEWKSLPGSGGTSFIIGDLLRDFSQDPTKDVGFAWAAKFPVKDTPSDLVEKAHRVHAYLAESAPGDNRIIFGILVWPSAEPVARYFGSLPGDFKGLEEFAVSLGLGLKEALASYAKNDLRIIGGIPILIAIPRPQKPLVRIRPLNSFPLSSWATKKIDRQMENSVQRRRSQFSSIEARNQKVCEVSFVR